VSGLNANGVKEVREVSSIRVTSFTSSSL
jgi:hypothetical protein